MTGEVEEESYDEEEESDMFKAEFRHQKDSITKLNYTKVTK